MKLFISQIRANPETDPDYGKEPDAPQEGEDDDILDDGTTKGHWNMRLSSFQKLMFIRGKRVVFFHINCVIFPTDMGPNS
mgnify:CR=1 FL=1